MCKGCAAAKEYQQRPVRYYDDPHPAELVENPYHKWRFYTQEANQSLRSFYDTLKRGEEALGVLIEKRKALSAKPTVEEKRDIFRASGQLEHFLVGASFTGLSAGEALDDAVTGLTIVAPRIARISETRDEARIARFRAAEEQIEAAQKKLQAQADEEYELIEAIFPDYDPDFKLMYLEDSFF